MSPHYGALGGATAPGSRWRGPALSSAGMAHPAENGPADPREPVTVIVDGANVMGSRADGWWHDRAGAMVRLHDELARLAERGVPRLPGDDVPQGGQTVAREPWFPHFVLVVEGRARPAAERVAPDRRVRVVAATGSGDDEIAALARDLTGRRFVITADRELRRRCVAAGAEVTGPRWLLRLLT
jgi:8-oxo-dGTP diphosphatase